MSPSSNWAATASAATRSRRAQSIKRLVDPKDIASLIVLLTSDAGKSISGQALPIDNDAQTSAY